MSTYGVSGTLQTSSYLILTKPTEETFSISISQKNKWKTGEGREQQVGSKDWEFELNPVVQPVDGRARIQTQSLCLPTPPYCLPAQETHPAERACALCKNIASQPSVMPGNTSAPHHQVNAPYTFTTRMHQDSEECEPQTQVPVSMASWQWPTKTWFPILALSLWLCDPGHVTQFQPF